MGQIGVVYAKGSKMIRRVIVPDSDEQLTSIVWHDPETEDILITEQAADMRDRANHHHVRKAMIEAFNIEPPVIVCAIIDGNDEVIHMIHADPAIDRSDEGELIEAYSPAITVGCTYDRATGMFWTKAHYNSPYTDRITGEQVAEEFVPAQEIAKEVVAPRD